MELYLVRHAWAEQQDSARWPDDSQRPLTPEGKKRFSKLIRQLAKTQFQASLIVTSPLLRAQQTAQLIAKALKKQGPTLLDHPELAPGGSLHKLVEWTAAQTAVHQAIAWVGHAPDIELFCAALIGQGQSLIHFSKGAVALVRFEKAPALGQGELQWLVTAKLLGI
ncbi:MAG: phosphohistidine phosphatase SixA [Thermoguttaceae bacterium]|nr:phosphohistidine phosphatase SixA [Thermoguttaceae bacterium]MDW8038740.1 phosphohistidine phosphatase SixA [Thermoguttaceae bacterium]